LLPVLIKNPQIVLLAQEIKKIQVRKSMIPLSYNMKTEGRYIGPGHAGIYKHTDGRYAFSFHYYDGQNEGKPRLAVRELNWIDNWPVVTKKDF
jgi:hypothetical protein